MLLSAASAAFGDRLCIQSQQLPHSCQQLCLSKAGCTASLQKQVVVAVSGYVTDLSSDTS
jgi:hypothetical protein